jgi:adenosylmethionine-8-amino-7-oxononanoate aminotransferase
VTTATAKRHLLLNMTANGSLGPEGEDLLVVRRGECPYVDDADGRRYIDGLSGLYCCQLGYSSARSSRTPPKGNCTSCAIARRVYNRSAPLVQIAPR